MPKKISVKTVDGNRYDFVNEDGVLSSVMEKGSLWYGVEQNSTTKWFYVPNIVSITEAEAEDGKTN